MINCKRAHVIKTQRYKEPTLDNDETCLKKAESKMVAFDYPKLLVDYHKVLYYVNYSHVRL